MEQTTTPTLRKRTTPVASSTLTGLMSDAPPQSASQLPSPLSSIDENMRAFVGEPEPSPGRSFTRRRRSSTKNVRQARSTSSLKGVSNSDRMDIPLAVALVPPVGALLTGGDFLRDFLLFLLLFFYLHQLIKLPWDLYLMSRPRGERVRKAEVAPDQERLHDLAEAELKTAELTYLTLSVLTPLLGASLLRYVGTVLTGKDYISWFSTGVFVLVTGIRPWRHLGHRLRSRTEELQDAIHTFRTRDGEDMPSRITRLEEEIVQLRREMATKDDTLKLSKEVDDSLDVLDAAHAKHERVVEIERRTTDERFAYLEKALASMLKDVSGRSQAWTLASPRSFFDWLHSQTVIPSKSSTIPSPARSTRPSYRPRLAAVREEEDGNNHQVKSKPRGRQQSNGLESWLDLVVYPFHAGRTLLWGIMDFLQRALV